MTTANLRTNDNQEQYTKIDTNPEQKNGVTATSDDVLAHDVLTYHRNTMAGALHSSSSRERQLVTVAAYPAANIRPKRENGYACNKSRTIQWI
jgi:hypothetical protein